MPSMSINRRSIAKLEPGTYYDEKLTGFGLKVYPSGVRTFFAEYRPGRGRKVAKRRLTIGSPDILSPEEAREAAEKILAKARLGIDTAGRLAEERAALTLAEVMDSYLREHIEAKKKAATHKMFKGTIDNHVRPALGSRPAHLVTRSDLAKLHAKIGLTRKPIANRMLAITGAAYEHALKLDRLPEGTKNPAIGIDRFAEAAKDRFLTTDELAALGAAIVEAETVGVPFQKGTSKHAPKNARSKLDPFAAAALRLLILTGCRLREILDLRWTEVDLERGALFLPDSKTGRKTVILGRSAIDLLATLPRVGIYVIAGDTAGQPGEKPRADLKRPWALVCRQAGLSGVRIHDLRHSFGSVGAGSGLGLPIVGKLLGHRNTATTQRYAGLADDPVRRAADLISGAMAAAMEGKRDGKS